MNFKEILILVAGTTPQIITETIKEASEDFEKQKISFLIKRRELLNRAIGIKK